MHCIKVLVILTLNVLAIGARYVTDIELDDDEAENDESLLSPAEDYHMLISGGMRADDRKLSAPVVSIRTAHATLYFGDNHFCAGALITRDWVVTAAHCVMDQNRILVRPRRLTVVSGTRNRFKQLRATLMNRVTKIVPHSGYVRKGKNDIAMLHLTESQEKLRFAFLPNAPPQVGETCQVLGWGELFKDGPYTEHLLYADVQIMDNEECKIYFPEGLPYDAFCATGANGTIDTCRGDSGGPLLCNGVLQGVIAWGYRCNGELPSVFTNVYTHRKWIKKHAAGAHKLIIYDALLYFALNLCWLFKGYLCSFKRTT